MKKLKLPSITTLLLLSTLLIIIVPLFFWVTPSVKWYNNFLSPSNNVMNLSDSQNGTVERWFIRDGFKTNTVLSSIMLPQVLDWWPWKNGIPSIDIPKFISQSDAEKTMRYLSEWKEGIVLTWKNEARFYPFDVLVWHEIVNDFIDNTPIAVTFCPLCGSSIVFDRRVEWEILEFWVSGKLYESNMLMYDRKTESFWSQSLGRAVIGDYLGSQLEYIWFQKMTYWEFKIQYPEGFVLSDRTWYRRNYGSIPYGDYDTNFATYFPVSFEDTLFHIKEIFYIIPYDGKSYAFNFWDIRDQKQASLKDIELRFVDGRLSAKHASWTELAWYFEMWFSWRTHNSDSRLYWSAKSQ